MEQGLVGTWIVKDMSRFGRDYLQVGRYTEIVFPSYDVRFIAVNDGVDSERGDNDFTPFRNLFNDFYAKDTSKKVRSVLKARGTSGKHMGKPPYGYRFDPADRNLSDDILRLSFATWGVNNCNSYNINSLE